MHLPADLTSSLQDLVLTLEYALSPQSNTPTTGPDAIRRRELMLLVLQHARQTLKSDQSGAAEVSMPPIWLPGQLNARIQARRAARTSAAPPPEGGGRGGFVGPCM